MAQERIPTLRQHLYRMLKQDYNCLQKSAAYQLLYIRLQQQAMHASQPLAQPEGPAYSGSSEKNGGVISKQVKQIGADTVDEIADKFALLNLEDGREAITLSLHASDKNASSSTILQIMSCQGTCQIHQTGTIPETVSQSFSYFEDDPFDFLSYNPDRQAEPLSVKAFDPFNIAESENIITDSTGGYPPQYDAPVADNLLLYPPSHEDQNARTGPTTEGIELRKLVEDLRDRTERIEEMIKSLHKEWKEDKERLCTEIEANVEKVENWNKELKLIVDGLKEELS